VAELIWGTRCQHYTPPRHPLPASPTGIWAPTPGYFPGITLRADTELRVYSRVQVLVNFTSLHFSEHRVLYREQTAHADTKLKHSCVLMNANINMKHQRLEVSLSPHTSTLLKNTKTGNIMAALTIYTVHNRQRGQTFLLNTDRCWPTEASEKLLACTQV